MPEEDDCDGRDGWWKVRGGSSGILGQYIPCGTGSLQSKNPTSRSVLEQNMRSGLEQNWRSVLQQNLGFVLNKI